MALPDAWVQRLFDRFAALYGVQKVGAMWAGANLDEVRAVWGEALGQFSGETLRKALEALEQTSTEWPPTLPSFVGLCKQYNRPEHRPALVAPGGNVTDDETARKNLALIREMLAGALKRQGDELVKRRFVLVHQQARDNAAECVRTAPEGYQVVVEPQKRTLPQNALFHALCGEAEKYALFMGRKHPDSQWKILFVSGHQVATGGHADICPGLENEFVNLYESTAKMNRKRKSSLIDYTIAWLETHGIDTRRARGYAEHEITT